jgi:hypothetical protein
MSMSISATASAKFDMDTEEASEFSEGTAGMASEFDLAGEALLRVPRSFFVRAGAAAAAAPVPWDWAERAVSAS